MSPSGLAPRTGPETPMPGTAGALAAYLAEDRDFRGIGPARAAALAAAFGDQLSDALARKHPEVIAILGDETATNAFATYELKSPEIALLDWLEGRGVASAVGTRTAIRIARCWGHDGVDALKDNPYLLASFLPWATTGPGLPCPRHRVRRSSPRGGRGRGRPLPPPRPQPYLDEPRFRGSRRHQTPRRRRGSERRAGRTLGGEARGRSRRRPNPSGTASSRWAPPPWKPS